MFTWGIDNHWKEGSNHRLHTEADGTFVIVQSMCVSYLTRTNTQITNMLSHKVVVGQVEHFAERNGELCAGDYNKRSKGKGLHTRRYRYDVNEPVGKLRQTFPGRVVT